MAPIEPPTLPWDPLSARDIDCDDAVVFSVPVGHVPLRDGHMSITIERLVTFAGGEEPTICIDTRYLDLDPSSARALGSALIRAADTLDDVIRRSQ